MLKDPFHLEETAYEILGLPFDAALPAVRDALKTFMKGPARARPHLLGAAAQAHKKLQSPVGRAELDIWFYDINMAGDLSESAKARDLHELGRPRALAPSELYCDLNCADFEADKREIATQRMKFSDVRAFDSIESIRFEPKFDH